MYSSFQNYPVAIHLPQNKTKVCTSAHNVLSNMGLFTSLIHSLVPLDFTQSIPTTLVSLLVTQTWQQCYFLRKFPHWDLCAWNALLWVPPGSFPLSFQLWLRMTSSLKLALTLTTTSIPLLFLFFLILLSGILCILFISAKKKSKLHEGRNICLCCSLL